MGSAEEAGTEGVDVSLQGDRLWGIAFSFRSPQVERRYREECLRMKLRHDVVAFAQGLVPGNLIAYMWWKSLTPMGRVHALINPLLCFVWLYLSMWKKETYVRWRRPIAWCVVFHGTLMLLLLGRSEEPPNPTWMATLGRIAIKSPALVTLYTSMNFSLFVRDHMLLVMSAFPLQLVWSLDFCRICCPTGKPENGVLETVGQGIEACLMLVSSFFMPSRIPCSCFTVISSMVLLLGALLPVALVYVLDIGSRKTFILQHYPSKMSSELSASMTGNLHSIWHVVLLVQNLWMGCCVLCGL